MVSLKTHEAEDFKERLRKLDVFLLEDVHFFQNKPKIQETALGIVKNIQDHGGRVIFTSSFSPKELQKVDSQLVSSFCSGIIDVSGLSELSEDLLPDGYPFVFVDRKPTSSRKVPWIGNDDEAAMKEASGPGDGQAENEKGGQEK